MIESGKFYLGHGGGTSGRKEGAGKGEEVVYGVNTVYACM
jgi:hypothetical protein